MDGDERLALILDDLIQQEQAGKKPDFEAVLRANPDLETELRQLWMTVILAEDFAGSDPSEASNSEVSHRPFDGVLPREFNGLEPLGELGRGGMGIVYRARQKSLGRTVALKMILRNDLASAADIARFRAEAEAAARLDHPHIVPVYEVGEHQGRPYFCMKLIEGSTLSTRLATGPLPAREAAELLSPIARAIAHAHHCGVLHRDIKPSNILIDLDGRPYVTDFGLAKRVASSDPRDLDAPSLHSLTQSGAVLGTPSYMAPEQAAGQRGSIAVETDVYSLGAVLYAMLTGRPPFQAASPVETVLMVLEQDPVPPRVLNPRADTDLELIAMKCLQKPQDLRYRSADALADDLDAYLRHEPISARSSQFTQVLSRAFRETHHASLLENWGLLWMWHSLVVLVLCLSTNYLQWRDTVAGHSSRWPYLALWVVGMSIWAAIFYGLRRRSGPVTFVERQIVHVWASSMIASMLLFAIEAALELPALYLSPVIGLISGMVFLVKASILTGKFYVQSVTLFLTGLLMAIIAHSDLPDFSISLYGVISAGSFFVPGLKYYRQRLKQ
jgi:serine/threonine-protein kinase